MARSRGAAAIAAASIRSVSRHSSPSASARSSRSSAGAEGLLCLLTDRIDAALLDAAPSLRVISNYAVGADNIDVAAAKARGIAVGYTPDVLTEATADLAFALLLAVTRRLPEGIAAVRDGEWKTWEPDWLLGRDVHGATLAIVGPGRIGRAVVVCAPATRRPRARRPAAPGHRRAGGG